jgi:hypothetical protein
MKLRLLLLTVLFSTLSWGQASLPLARTTWDSTPLGWIDTPLDSYTSTFACSTNNGAKFDTTGDLKIVNFNSSPNQLSFDVKSNTATTSVLLVEESVDGITYTNVVSLSGSAALPTTCTTKGPYTLNSTSRFVRWTFTKGTSNMTMDDVSITASSANTIITSAITGSPFCVTSSTGAAVSVPFTSTGTFTAGNIYTAQLSNAAGSFAAPTTIGTLSSTANSGTIAGTIPAATTAGTGYRIRVISSTPLVTGSDNTVNLTVQNAASITTQPSSAVQNICQGSAATALTVSATGTTLSYQWYSNTIASNSGGTTVGTNSASYTPLTTSVGTLYYYCVVSAACGASVTSNVSGAVNITGLPSTPSGAITATPSCGSSSLAYSLPSATVYWQTTAGGTSTANPTTSPLVVTTSGTYYVRNYNGTCWSTGTVSQAVTIVNAVAITTQPTNQSTTVGNTATFNVTASNAVSYQWQISTNGGGTWSNIGTNTNSYTTPSATLLMNGYQYRVIITGTAPCTNVTSSVATLSVTTGPCLSENFNSFTGASFSGWTATGLSNYTSAASSGVSPNSVQFNDSGDVLISPTFTNATELTFWIKGNGTDAASSLLIEGYNGVSWVVVNTISALPTTGTVITYNASSSPILPIGLQQFRFTYSKSAGNLAFDDVTVYCGPTCTPAVISSITPSSGPVGTEITINASSGNLTGATVTFGVINATIVSSSASQIIAIVPSGATTGMISINDSQPCTANAAFTVITRNNSSCEGATTSDLIIYDIHDEQTGNGGFITLYNGTAAVVNLTNYRLYRTSTHDDGFEIDYGTLTGTIASGALGIIKVSIISCGPAATNGSIAGGFNEDDGIQLRNAAGTVVIDDVDTYPTAPGYYMVRNTGALNARTSYVAADWNTITLVAGECYPSAGLVLPSGLPPTISAQPTVSITCTSSSATLSVTATEGFAGGNPLAYQWYVVAPNTSAWTALTNAGVYSGANSSSLVISSLVGLNNYQYYCQVRENTATCYQATIAVKITDLSTVWNGTTWSNGIPDSTKFATINGNYDTTANGNIECCSLLVNTGFTLDIQAATYVEIQYNLTVNGTLNVLNNGSLVQVDDSGVNTGNISYQRSTTGVALDYVYWSSPVGGVNTPAGVIYKWSPTFVNPNGGEGYWTGAANTAMLSGSGYIMRDIFSRNFIGTPYNGVVTSSIARGSDLNAGTAGPNGTMRTITDDNWNLLGNPYPSAISIGSFLTANSDLDGFVRLWTHGTSPSTAIADPFYDNFVSNYTASDYIAINGAGATSGPGTLSVIGGGQGFFTLMNPGTAATSSATFNNSMRNKGYSNSQFYRASKTNKDLAQNTSELNRIWLDLQTPTNETTRILVAYVDDATNLRDRMYDAITDYKSAQNLYTLIGADVFAIQGRAPFNEEDKVPVGFKTSTQGTHTISIAFVDGLFENGQNIYLEDQELNIIHDLRQNPYSFYAPSEVNNERFVLRYTDGRLSNDDNQLLEDELIVVSNENIQIISNNIKIKSVEIFDVLGRKLISKTNVEANSVIVNEIAKSNNALIINIILENNIKISRKILF